MNTYLTIVCVILVISHLTTSQLPPRISIPGALLLPQSKPFRQQRIQQEGGPPRLRRPITNASPAPIRPVVEEIEEPATSPASNFDDEVSKLGISALQSAIKQAAAPEEEPLRPLPFRPERPLPVLRENIRENPASQPRPVPVLRQEVPHRQIPIARPLPKYDDIPISRPPQPVRARQQIPQAAPQPIRQPARQPTRQYSDDNGEPQGRTRKPPVQILRKYRTDNADGSITWGYENEDGTFKEETLGVDCVTRGKYGYIDPDGVRREYTYETGNKCDEPEEEQLIPQDKVIQPQPRKPASQPQFRPGPAQY